MIKYYYKKPQTVTRSDMPLVDIECFFGQIPTYAISPNLYSLDYSYYDLCLARFPGNEDTYDKYVTNFGEALNDACFISRENY